MKRMIWLCLFLCTAPAWAQVKNDVTEVFDYREADGKVIVGLVVNGVRADFVLDLAGHTAILPEYVEIFDIEPLEKGRPGLSKFKNRETPVSASLKASSISMGNIAFVNGVPVLVLGDEPYLRQLGVAGVVGASIFRNVVLTIDVNRKKITMSRPYRPNYMQLDRRADIEERDGYYYYKVVLDGTPFLLLLDTWSEGMVTLNEADFARLNAPAAGGVKIAKSLGAADQPAAGKTVRKMDFVKEAFADVAVAEDKALTHSVLGNGILKKGLLSIDFIRRKIYFQPFDLAEVKDEVVVSEVEIVPGKLNAINREYFLKHVFDYRTGKEFVYNGEKPVVIDFWATWCGPCMKLIPQMEKLAAKYKDQIIFLKVNADKEKELCGMYNVTALPTLFFIPVGGKPIVEIGEFPEKFVEIIEKHLLNNQK